MLQVNSEQKDEFIGNSLLEMLKKLHYNVNYVAVEINGSVVPKAYYENMILQDGDKVQIVTFVRGG